MEYRTLRSPQGGVAVRNYIQVGGALPGGDCTSTGRRRYELASLEMNVGVEGFRIIVAITEKIRTSRISSR